MDKEEQYLLFALSTPMEVLNSRAIGAKPSHFSPAMYTGKHTLISPIHGGLITVKILFKPSIG